MSNLLKPERIALGWVVLALLLVPGTIFGYQSWRAHPAEARVIEISARAPFSGGWQPDTIRVKLGERVRLRPFRDEEELCGLSHAINATPNAFWGPNHLPSPKLKRDFEPGGMLSPDGRCIFVIERLDTAEAVGIEICRLPSPGAIMGNAGTLILEQHWHRGFGIEAKQLCFCFQFESAPVERIEAVLGRHRLGSIVGVRNPLDVTPILGDEGYEEAAAAILDDPGVDVGVVGCVPLSGMIQTLAPAGKTSSSACSACRSVNCSCKSIDVPFARDAREWAKSLMDNRTIYGCTESTGAGKIFLPEQAGRGVQETQRTPHCGR